MSGRDWIGGVVYGKDPIYYGRLRHGEESYGMVRCD